MSGSCCESCKTGSGPCKAGESTVRLARPPRAGIVTRRLGLAGVSVGGVDLAPIAGAVLGGLGGMWLGGQFGGKTSQLIGGAAGVIVGYSAL